MFSGIRPKAVLLGIIADIGATLLISTALITYLGAKAGMESLPEEEARQLIVDAFQTPPYLLLGGVLGLLATALGGFVAARVAGVAPLLNAACVGVFGVLLGILFIGEAPLWFSLIAILLTPPAAIAGGVVWRRSNPPSPS